MTARVAGAIAEYMCPARAVASDEANNGSGEFDEWKRNRLLGVGADIVIPDYRDAELLLNVIEGK